MEEKVSKTKAMEAAEHELEELIEGSRLEAKWLRFHELVSRVRDGRLYEARGYKKFSAWFSDFLHRNRINKGGAYEMLRAGDALSGFMERSAITPEESRACTPAYETLANISKAGRSLLLAGRFGGGGDAADAMRDWVDGKVGDALRGKLDRGESRRILKKANAAKGESGKGTGGPGPEGEYGAGERAPGPGGITADEIKEALARDCSWIGRPDPRAPNFSRAAALSRNIYTVFTEFPLGTGTTSHSRRVDALVVENLSSRRISLPECHAVEIKVSPDDLMDDVKFMEYGHFADRLWLAVPASLGEAALRKIEEAGRESPGEIGLLTFERDGDPKGSGRLRVSLVREAGETGAVEGVVETLRKIAFKTLGPFRADESVSGGSIPE